MRTVVVFAHDLAADTAIALDDLPGAGRLDLLSRCVTSACLLSHDVREDTRIELAVDGYAVRFEGSELRRLNPDERSTAARIRDALDARGEAIGEVAAPVSPGVSIRGVGRDRLLETASGPIVELHAEGDPLVDAELPADPVFVLSDHRGFTDAERELLDSHAEHRVSVGPRALHADQAITVAHNYLDTDGYERYGP